MKKLMLCAFVALIYFCFFVSPAFAINPPPYLSVSTAGVGLSLDWGAAPNAQGYILSYALKPYTGPSSISSIDVGDTTYLNYWLWPGAAYFVAVQAYDSAGNVSNYSDVGQFTIMSSSNPSQLVQIEASLNDMIAIDYWGRLWVWGVNDYGEFTDEWSSRANSGPALLLSPFTRQGASQSVSRFRAVAAGNGHFLAVDENGSVWTWGRNDYGQLGEGGTNSENRVTPKALSGLPAVVSVEAGVGFSMALDSNGNVWTWGTNLAGCLGIDTSRDMYNYKRPPTRVPGLPKIKAISANQSHAMALDVDGNVWTWGNNYNGQLGDGNTRVYDGRYTPQMVSGLPVISDISSGGDYSLALASSVTGEGSTRGSVWMWGENNSAVLGYSTNDDVLTPTRVAGLQPMARIEAGPNHCLAIDHDGAVWTWGQDFYRNNPYNYTLSGTNPLMIQELGASVKDVAITMFSSVALKTNLYGWGLNINNFTPEIDAMYFNPEEIDF